MTPAAHRALDRAYVALRAGHADAAALFDDLAGVEHEASWLPDVVSALDCGDTEKAYRLLDAHRNTALGISGNRRDREAFARWDMKRGGTWDECAAWLRERGVEPDGTMSEDAQ